MFTTEELRKPRKNVANKRLLFIEIRNQQKGSKHVRCTSRAAWPRVSQHRTRVGKQAASDILRETTQQFRAFTDQNVCVYIHRPMYTHIKICKGSSKSYGKCILWKHCMDFKYFWHQNKLIFNSIFQVYLRFPPIFHTYTHISSQENATVIQCPVSHTYTVIRAHRCWGVCLYQIAGVWMWNRHHSHSWPWSYGHTRLSHPTICIKIRRAKLFFRSNQNQGLPIAFTFRIQWLNLNKHFIPKSSGIFKS